MLRLKENRKRIHNIIFLLNSMLLNHCFSQLRSTQVTMIHCSAYTAPHHILQKLSQVSSTYKSIVSESQHDNKKIVDVMKM